MPWQGEIYSYYILHIGICASMCNLMLQPTVLMWYLDFWFLAFFRSVSTCDRKDVGRTRHQDLGLGSWRFYPLLVDREFLELRLGWQWLFQNPQGLWPLRYREYYQCRSSLISFDFSTNDLFLCRLHYI